MPANTNNLPIVAQYTPYYEKLELGKSYLWCSCGLSKTQPFCDQSHRGTDFRPVRYVAQQAAEEVLFCGCKQTLEPPFCDGAHNNLKGEYDNDDPDSPENLRVAEVVPAADGRAVLDGGCYVAKLDRTPRREIGTLSVSAVITGKTGAIYQSQFYISAAQGPSPILRFGIDSDVILMVTTGGGAIDISGQEFELKPEMGVYIRPGEAFRFHNPNPSQLIVFATICPLVEAPDVLDHMPRDFDASFPRRTIETNTENRTQMANRFWQILVDSTMGSTSATQFIGEIPQSKAMPHRHLYEESLVVLSGEGYMWTENKKARVSTGDVIFLPSKQRHSLQCTTADGMYLSGIIYPGSNPGVNYL